MARILAQEGKVILLDTFAPEQSESRAKRVVFTMVNRAYAVLSQYPHESLIVRFAHGTMSYILPNKYNAEDYGYYSPLRSETISAFEA
jgi:hypothetical protein